MAEEKEGRIRIDKWLWAARFFRTRSLATQAVSGGKVHLNGERVKPAHAIARGDTVRVRRGVDLIEFQVLGLSARRGPARIAAQLYEESPESMALRELSRDERATERAARPVPGPRPDKRERRRHARLLRGPLPGDDE